MLYRTLKWNICDLAHMKYLNIGLFIPTKWIPIYIYNIFARTCMYVCIILSFILLLFLYKSFYCSNLTLIIYMHHLKTMLIYFHKTSILYINAQECLLKFWFLFQSTICVLSCCIYYTWRRLWSVTSTYFKWDLMFYLFYCSDLKLICLTITLTTKITVITHPLLGMGK